MSNIFFGIKNTHLTDANVKIVNHLNKFEIAEAVEALKAGADPNLLLRGNCHILEGIVLNCSFLNGCVNKTNSPDEMIELFEAFINHESQCVNITFLLTLIRQEYTYELEHRVLIDLYVSICGIDVTRGTINPYEALIEHFDPVSLK